MAKNRKQNWGYSKAKWLVATCADEGIQRQLSAMGRKQNISENNAGKLK